VSLSSTVAHVGPIARNVTDAALMLDVLSLPDARDWNALPYEARDYRTTLEHGVQDCASLSRQIWATPRSTPK